MIDKIKRINNPLTVIVVFAALAEISGTVALSCVAKDLQIVFIWFVMLFPTLLVLLFFVTLNLNPKVLYAPSDFRDESNFIGLISKTEIASNELGNIAIDIDNTRKELIDIVSKVESDNKADIDKISDLIDRRLKSAFGNISVQRGNVLRVAEAFNDNRALEKLFGSSNDVKCPKCFEDMAYEEGDFHCHRCE